ncbi:MAG: glycosyltransferase [Clostridium sp.]|nr:glycosyltransferase [Clostridium sp.]
MDLLTRCVSSIPVRDDIQIIIIDDNSDPRLVDFNKFPYKSRKNLSVVFDKTNKHQGHARNVGIDLAEGKWLIFADSDDYFFYSINRALDENLNNNADIIYFKATILDNETYSASARQDCMPNISVEKYLKGDKYGEHLVRYRYPVPWGKMFKSSLIKKHNIRFAEIERLEDAQFSYQAGYYANAIDVKNYSIYCYVKRNNTVTTNVNPSSGYNLIKVCSDCNKFLLSKGLADTPTYFMMNDLIFDELYRMKVSENKFFNESIDYLVANGVSIKSIRKNIRKMRIVHYKSKFFKLLHR